MPPRPPRSARRSRSASVEAVQVTVGSEIIQTQSSTVSTTINTKQISKLPLTSRSAMDFVNCCRASPPRRQPPRDHQRPAARHDQHHARRRQHPGQHAEDDRRFLRIVSPRLDAIEEVTVTTASQGADAGQGAVQIKFVTRGGTNAFTAAATTTTATTGSTPTPGSTTATASRSRSCKQDQAGFRVGGPIVIPGLFDGRNKAFFFVNYEELRQPSEITRNRTMLNPRREPGNYTLNTGGGMHGQRAGAGRATARLDGRSDDGQDADRHPRRGGDGGDLDRYRRERYERYTFNVGAGARRTAIRRVRLDYNLTRESPPHRLPTTTRIHRLPGHAQQPRGAFPGFPVAAGQASIRTGFGLPAFDARREPGQRARFGYGGAPVTFFERADEGHVERGSVANQGGFQINFPIHAARRITDAPNAADAQSRNATTLLIEDTLNWLKGSHSISLGGSFTQSTSGRRTEAAAGDRFRRLDERSGQRACSRPRISPARRRPNVTAARESVCPADRARQPRSTATRASTRPPASTSTSGPARSEAGCARRLLPAGSVAPAAEPDGERRPALRAAEPVPSAQQQLLDRDDADVCGVSGVSARRRLQPVPAGHARPARHPQFVNFGKGQARLQHRLEQPRAERRRRRGRRGARPGCSAR